MSLKYQRTVSFIFILVVTMVTWLLLFSSSSTQAATADASVQQSEQAESVNQEQPIIRPELILDVSIDPEPIVGEIVTLRIKVTSALDEPDVLLMVQMSDEIDLIAGDLTWNGTISSATPLVHEMSIAVREAGNWVITINSGASSFAVDSERLHLISTANSGEVIPSAEYRVVQSLDTWPGDPSEIIPYEIPKPPLRTENIDELAPQAAGQVTIQGNITFGFEYEDCRFASWNCPGQSVGVIQDTMPLRNAQIRLYDRATVGSDTYLATVTTGSTISNSGFYAFTVDNIDPDGDGTGIDPLVLIFPMGPEFAEKVTIYDAVGTMYFEAASAPDNDLGDGTIYTFDYHIPHAPSQTDMGQVMYVFDQMANEAYGFLEDELGWGNSEVVKVNYPQGCIFGAVDNSCYIGEIEGIAIYDPDGARPDVIIHEYGHFVLSRYLGDIPVVQACAPVFNHSFTEPTIAPSCAWSEGWADFFQMAVQNDPDYVGRDMEIPDSAILPLPGDDPASWEAAVVATLWDIFDGTGTESSGFVDNIADGFNGSSDNGIWNLTTQMANNPNDIVQFWDLWIANRNSEVDVGCELLDQHQLLYELIIDIIPANSGEVVITDPPSEFDCPTLNKFLDTRFVELQAVPATNFAFSQWSGDATSIDPILYIPMEIDRSVTAEFVSIASPTPSSTPSGTPTMTPTP
ncbi:hypothetical protein MNBD_CHLOROFLEXI01-1172, partial [hydrothermal vent metagenome]